MYINILIIEGWQTFFHKGPDTKYFRLPGSYGLCHDDSALQGWLNSTMINSEQNE